MLTEIRLQHFKCLRDLDLECKPLNLLCGINGTGKSSVIQSILLLRQSVESLALNEGRLDLVGNRVDLGTGSDVIHDGDVPRYVRFQLQCSEIQSDWQLNFQHITGDDATFSGQDGLFASAAGDKLTDFLPDGWDQIPPFGGRFVYVPADRVGPLKMFPESVTLAKSGDFGANAEYALNFLAQHRGDLFEDGDPRNPNASEQLLDHAIDYWMQTISPGVLHDIQSVDAASMIILGYRFEQPGDVPTRPYRATNVGFGLSYTLPVILALLSRPGTLCLVENPEAHLHPRGQTKLGELAARAASAGVQIFVETHSDHFMDGVRIAVRDGLITPDDVTFNYFQREGNTATVTSPTINEDGRLSDWPEGFFDQNALNLARLLAPKS